MNCELAAELNNLAAAYLEAGYLRKSLELFRDALRYTLCDLQPQEPTPVLSPASAAEVSLSAAPHPVSAQQESMMDRDKMSDPRSSEFAPDPVDRETIRQKEESSVPFVHSNAINVIPSPHAYSPDELINTTVVSSIILFNLALVYHLKGLEASGESTMRLAKARSLYQKSQLLLADARVPLSSTGNPVIDMLVMALYNNLAQASFEMSIYEDSRVYFEGLIRFALTVTPSRYGDASIASMIDQQKSNFLLNAIILHAPKLAAAA